MEYQIPFAWIHMLLQVSAIAEMDWLGVIWLLLNTAPMNPNWYFDYRDRERIALWIRLMQIVSGVILFRTEYDFTFQFHLYYLLSQ